VFASASVQGPRATSAGAYVELGLCLESCTAVHMAENGGAEQVSDSADQHAAQPSAGDTKPHEHDTDSAVEKASLQAHSGSTTVGEEGGNAVESAGATTTGNGDPTRPSDEQILSYENQLRYCA
jgi:hypothetical protein